MQHETPAETPEIQPTSVPEAVAQFAQENQARLAHLSLTAAMQPPSKQLSMTEMLAYARPLVAPLRNAVMLMTPAGESLLLFHSEQERKAAADVLNQMPSLVREASHLVYNHKEPKAAMVNGKVYALKMGASLAIELVGLKNQQLLNLPINEIKSEDDLVREYRDFARKLTPQTAVLR